MLVVMMLSNQPAMQKLPLLLLFVVMNGSAFAQHIGATKKGIIDAEKKNGAEWKKKEGDRWESVSGGINTFYKFEQGKCTNIVKITSKGGMGELKKFLTENEFVYDTETSQYKRNDIIGTFKFNSEMISLTIAKDKELAIKSTK